MTRRVLVTGGAGYIGSVLVEMLLQEGYDVRFVDRFFFDDTLSDLRGDSRLELVRGDIRWVSEDVLAGVWAVFDLTALSNDPAGELNPRKTLAINAKGRIRMADMAGTTTWAMS